MSHQPCGCDAALAKTRAALFRTRLPLGVEALCAAQGIEFRAPLTTSAPLARVLARLRQDIAALAEDRYMAPDLEAAAGLVRSAALTKAAGVDMPELGA